MKYEGHNGQVTVEGDSLIVTREGLVARAAFGKLAARRVPLQAISGVTLQEATRLKNGWLQLHLGGGPAQQLSMAGAASNGDTVMFTHGKREQWGQLHGWLLSVVEQNRAAGVDPSAAGYQDGGAGQVGRFEKLADSIEASATTSAAKAAHRKQAQVEAGGLRDDIAQAATRMRVTFGAGREVKKLAGYLWDGETVTRMTTGTYGKGTGLIVMTDRRLLFVQDGIMSQSSEDFPYSKVSSVQWNSGMLLGTLTVFASGNKAVLSNINKDDGREMSDALRERLADGPARVSTSGAAQPDVMEQLKKLAELRDVGIVTKEEFEAKKADLLARL